MNGRAPARAGDGDVSVPLPYNPAAVGSLVPALLLSAGPGGDASGGGAFIGMLPPLVLTFVIFYFLLIRPQQKKERDRQAQLAALKKGDRVVTSGGIVGTVAGNRGDQILLLVDERHDVRMTVLRSAITTILGEKDGTEGGNGKADEPAEPSAVSKGRA